MAQNQFANELEPILERTKLGPFAPILDDMISKILSSSKKRSPEQGRFWGLES